MEEIEQRLRTAPGSLLAVMRFETGGTFDPTIRNQAGSGATGLIQFMPQTARGLGTTTDALARMSPERQLDYVERYFQPYKGKLGSLQDTYMAVLYPKAIGKPEWHPLFSEGTTAYRQNAGLDRDKKGVVTVGDAVARVQQAGGEEPPRQWWHKRPAVTQPQRPCPRPASQRRWQTPRQSQRRLRQAVQIGCLLFGDESPALEKAVEVQGEQTGALCSSREGH